MVSIQYTILIPVRLYSSSIQGCVLLAWFFIIYFELHWLILMMSLIHVEWQYVTLQLKVYFHLVSNNEINFITVSLFFLHVLKELIVNIFNTALWRVVSFNPPPDQNEDHYEQRALDRAHTSATLWPRSRSS